MSEVQTEAFVGNWFLEVGDGASPETFTRYCEVTGLSELGQTNEQIDATTTCGGGNKQFIPGLAEGSEVSIEANYAPTNTVQNGLIQDVKNKVTRNFRVVIEQESPETVFSFSAAMLSWKLSPSVTAQNKIAFTGKISGDIEIV